MATDKEQFHATIARLTEPLNGQFPRPWMTEMADPLSAEVLIVGKNQAKGYESCRLTHQRHLDALFNRNGESCRRVYDEMTGFTPSLTRQNTDRFRAILAAEGVTRVLETNVICYSTPMSVELRLPEHRGGTVRGSEIFQTLLDFLKPKVLIAHGAGARETMAKLLGASLPWPPAKNGDPQPAVVGGMKIYIIPSLAPPQWNRWHCWAEQYLTKVATETVRAI